MTDKDKQNELVAYKALNNFFQAYLVERNFENTLSMVTDDIYSIGTGKDEYAFNKLEFANLLKSEFSILPNPMKYKLIDYKEKQYGENNWDCFCNVEIKVTIEKAKEVTYLTRLTASFVRKDNRILASALHLSEASIHQEENEFFPLKYSSEEIEKLNKQSEQDLLDLVMELMPGGIVGSYFEDGYPLYIVNDKYLALSGYTNYNDFVNDTNGFIANTIHPEDLVFVENIATESLKNGRQYEVEYRLRKKDGTYIWVYDMGRKICLDDGREAIISVVIDVSERVLKNINLKKEASRDALTRVYNRRYGIEYISNKMNSLKKYAFIIMDIDNFKLLNDIYGHSEGDYMLQFISRQIKCHFKESDIVFRLGGDEFIIFTNKFNGIHLIEIKLMEISRKYKMKIDEKYKKSYSSLSFGIVIGQKTTRFSQVYKMADSLLYEVKRDSKDDFKIKYIE